MFFTGEPPVCTVGPRYCGAHLMLAHRKGAHTALPTVIYSGCYINAFSYHDYSMADLTKGLLDLYLGYGLVS